MALWARSKVFRLSKGYYGRSKNCFRIAIRRVIKGLQYEYISRRVRRREVREGWIRSVNAGVRDLDISYSRFIYGLNRSNIMLDRKILSNLAQNEPYSFKAVVDEVKTNIPNHMLKTSEKKVSYAQAVDSKMLHFGTWEPSEKDKEFRYVKLANPNDEDWYGVNRPDFPTFYLDMKRKHKTEGQMPLKEMKKLRFTAWDDVPSDADD
jgi:large subunit ribosomal protein L20